MASTMEFLKYNIQPVTSTKLAFDFSEFAIDGMDQKTELDSEGTYIYFKKPLPTSIESIEYADEQEVKINGENYSFQSEIGYWASDYNASNVCDEAITKAIVKWYSKRLGENIYEY